MGPALSGPQPQGSRVDVLAPQGEILDSTGEQRRAHQASYDAKAAAWETLRTSPYASALGVTGHAPQETGALGEKLGEIRERVAQVAQRLDDSHQQDAARLTGNAVKAGEKAVEWSSHLRLAQAEQGQRVEIASKFPASTSRRPPPAPSSSRRSRRPRPPSEPESAVRPPTTTATPTTTSTDQTCPDPA